MEVSGPDGAAIEVHYAHGYDRPPSDVVDAIMQYVEELLADNPMPRRATSVSTDVGAFRISTAGRDGFTGIPDLDAAVEAHARRRPTVG